jgi:hypothetical protein
VTEHFRAGFSESRSRGGRSGGGRSGVTAARDDEAAASEGVYWTPAHKDAGSRQNGWELFRERLKNVLKPDGPRLFLLNNCRQFIRTVPVLPRDEIDRDDVDGAAEEHGRLGFALGTKGRSRFRSRSVRRFSCGTPGCCQGFWNHDRLF